ncbi:MAG: hybrid sensor histidine kinase/response regulator [Alcanivoracaceae bacterium]|nr:hybrid sensor histidine kinase/response regulator [Alcanivoracaceae bacterium]
MIGSWTIYIILIMYMGLMYLIATWGDKQDFSQNKPVRASIYSLSIAVYCTSWTFFGAVGTAAKTGWDFLSIYLGPILLFTLGWPLVKKIVKISKKKKVTSIADFVASLYGKSRKIAVLVTGITVLAAIPYISLQLETISASLEVIAISDTQTKPAQFRTFIIAGMLAFFSIVFGTKKLDVTEHHRGLMMAIAFESLLKLIAFIAVGLFAVFFLYSGPADFFQVAQATPKIANGPSLSMNFISQVLLAFLVFMCLPRQFHVTVVENENRSDLKWSRWVFVSYLVLFSIFVIPIAMAGNQWLGGGVSADLYVLKLPMYMQQEWLTLLVLVGGLAAASGMVIISTIALSTMVSNDFALPLYLKFKKYNLPQKTGIQNIVLWSRRASIIIITLMAYLFYYYLNADIPLASFGNLSFLLTVQFAPTLLLGLYWNRSNKKAAFAGLSTGVVVWVMLVFFPQWFSPENHNIQHGILLTLQQLTSDNSPLFKLVSYSLLSNVVVHVLYALIPGIFGKQRTVNLIKSHNINTNSMTVKELKVAVSQIIGKDIVDSTYENFYQGINSSIDDDSKVSTPIIAFTERLLAGSIGSSSARAVITALFKSKGLAVNDIVGLLDETSQAIRFQRRLTNATLDSISQGVSVVDGDLRLVSWNKQYLKLLDYPEQMVYKGMPIEDLIRFNASRGLLGEKNIAAEVEKRLIYLRKRTHYRHEKSYGKSRYLQIEGNPMPDNGYVTTYTDVSHFKKIEHELETSKASLEQRVNERTLELLDVNKDLELAKQKAESANSSKTKFVADASHDLLQPFNAARLFSSILTEQVERIPDEMKGTVLNLDLSLKSAENLLGALLDIAKIDAGGMTIERSNFSVNAIFDQLRNQYQSKAQRKGLKFKVIASKHHVNTDQKLLYRVLQNLTSNALKYTENGGVLVVCRKQQKQLQIYVIDSGEGLCDEEQKLIFNDFLRLNKPADKAEQGLGLGLSIVDRIIKQLGHKLLIRSVLGKGSAFMIELPLVAATTKEISDKTEFINANNLVKPPIVCIDNEKQILIGMQQLITNWGHRVYCVLNSTQALSLFADGLKPAILLVDYHLDNETGIEVIEKIFKTYNCNCPVIIITANRTEELKTLVKEKGYDLLLKPIKPAILRNVINRLCSNTVN